MLFTCIRVRRKNPLSESWVGRESEMCPQVTSSLAEKSIHEKVVSRAEVPHQQQKWKVPTHACACTPGTVNKHTRTHAAVTSPCSPWCSGQIPCWLPVRDLGPGDCPTKRVFGTHSSFGSRNSSAMAILMALARLHPGGASHLLLAER